MVENIDIFTAAEQVLESVLKHNLEKAKSHEAVYDSLALKTAQLIRYHNEEQNNPERINRIKGGINTALFNMDIYSQSLADMIEQEAIKHLKSLKKPAEAEKDSPAQETKPAKTEPQKKFTEIIEKPKPKPKNTINPENNEHIYETLINKGGEIAKQTWLFAKRYHNAQYTLGHFGYENWLFKAALCQAGTDRDEINNIKSGIKEYTKKAENIGEEPLTATPLTHPPFAFDQGKSPKATYNALKQHGGIVAIATDYIINLHINDDSKFFEPNKHSIIRDLAKFRNMLMKETDLCSEQDKDTAKAITAKIIEYAKLNTKDILRGDNKISK